MEDLIDEENIRLKNFKEIAEAPQVQSMGQCQKHEPPRRQLTVEKKEETKEQ